MERGMAEGGDGHSRRRPFILVAFRKVKSPGQESSVEGMHGNLGHRVIGHDKFHLVRPGTEAVDEVRRAAAHPGAQARVKLEDGG